jgi:hypothetical protein
MPKPARPAALVPAQLDSPPGFAVEIHPPHGTFSSVPTTLSPRRKNRRPAKAAARKAFWARPANPELDRSGDWLLKNLTTTRAKAVSRAGPA